MRLYRTAVLISAISIVLVAQGAVAVEVPFWGRSTVEGDFAGAASVVSGDLDGDGDLDLLGTSSDRVTWWENGGRGAIWTEHLLDSSFDGAASAVAADMDGDGDLDVLGAASIRDEISWWENLDGDATAWYRHTIESNFDGALAALAADMDGDGDLDVLGVAFFADDITWWELTNPAGNGTWTPHVVDANFDDVRSVFAADVDGDGDLDVLGASSNIQGVHWWENTAGDGSAWVEHSIVIGAMGGVASVVAADMDGDGDLDVLAGMSPINAIGWWENTAGNATAWLGHSVDTAFDGTSVVAVDLDADGDLDVLAAGYSDFDITWWENTVGDGTAWTEHTIDGEFLLPRCVHAADLDGDGNQDVLAASYYSDPTYPDIVRYQNATIHRSAVYPTRSPITADVFEAASVHAADLDGDGDQDVLAAMYFQGLDWWENAAGDGTVWTRHTVEASFNGASSVSAADIDGDGDLDVLGAAVEADTIAWWENTAGNGTAWIRHTVADNVDGAMSVQAADVDGDGDQDLLGAGFFADDIAWWENTARDGSAWTRRSLDIDFDGARAVAAADVDGDGDQDVLGAAFVANDLVWWENQAGDGTGWGRHTLDADFAAPASISLADVDGDGDVDVLGASKGVGADVVWWENANGDGTAWTKHTVGQMVSSADAVLAADVDGDGDLDVLAAGGFGGDVIWWENDRWPCGSSCIWSAHTVDGDVAGVNSITAADMDGDGDLDVLGAATQNPLLDIAWWSNRGGQFALPTADTAPPSIANGQIADVLRIDARHRGWGSVTEPPDSDVELKTFELRFEEAPGDPLSTTEARRLIQSLRIYLDDGSGSFDVADALVTSVGSLALDAGGVQTVAFADNDPDVRLSPGSFAVPRIYFVVVEMTATASSQTPNRFRLTHLTESSSKAEDAAFELPLKLEFSANVSSGTLVALAPGDLIFANGFE